MLYAVPNLETTYDLVKLNVGSPTFQRAPGESTGTFALESAMDELSYELDIDPIELRLKNYAERDPESEPAVVEQVAARVLSSWARSNSDGRSAIRSRARCATASGSSGYGMATATYPARRQAAGTTARLNADGRVTCAPARRRSAAARTR